MVAVCSFKCKIFDAGKGFVGVWAQFGRGDEGLEAVVGREVAFEPDLGRGFDFVGAGDEGFGCQEFVGGQENPVAQGGSAKGDDGVGVFVEGEVRGWALVEFAG